MLSAYCLSYGNWTVIPSHWERVFGDMRECGFDTVALSFSESERMYSMRTFEQQVHMAHKQGLKVIAIPSRIGGRFAGAPFMPSPWLVHHPESQVPGNPLTACLNDPVFRDFAKEYIRMIVQSFDVDGLVLDEPKAVDTICRHPSTVALYGPEPTEHDMHRSMLDFLSMLIAEAKSLRSELSITLFNMPPVSPEFTRMSAALSGIDYAGFDGTCCSQSYFHETPWKHKRSVRENWPRTLDEVKGVTGTFALIENILIPDTSIEEFKREYVMTLDEVHPDHLSVYYYGHNNESAELIQKFCMDELKKRYT